MLLDATDRPQAETLEHAHGRLEHRRAEVAPAGALAGKLACLCAVARITTTRDGAVHTRLYALSRCLNPDQALQITRAHWSVENQLHWVLDVALGEDLNRARKDNAPSNIALLNRLALNALIAIDDPKTSIRTRIKKEAREDTYLLKALSHLRQACLVGEGWGGGSRAWPCHRNSVWVVPGGRWYAPISPATRPRPTAAGPPGSI